MITVSCNYNSKVCEKSQTVLTVHLFLLSGTIGVPTDLFLLSADLPSLQTVKNPTLSDCAENN